VPAVALALGLVVGHVLGLATGGRTALAQDMDPARIDTLSPSELMALYQARCAGGAGAGTLDEGAAAARALGQRCDALAAAIQDLSLDDRRGGSDDLARPDFYTPGAR
jgi:hypothetical protein